MARNRAIGFEGALPWHLPRELKHFRDTTLGKPVVMGRKTHESIGRPLPGRQNIVVSRNRNYRSEGCDTAISLRSAVEAADGDEVMVIGGGQLYEEALPVADRMVLTHIECEPRADTWFPAWERDDWVETIQREERQDENNRHAYRVIEYTRKA
ncbi:MAG: dihydrofolate reductase [Xanthomonadales bacterium]|nr:dihydrofolate reductase [Gammaproteobacteria bacterium]NND44104.1 dihydrofolate reductase [Xanthomonadales bacterium]MBT8051767.1 dihydrofolate reductase [Gammaproteobacteria bacterium]MBT8055456.1 dihydrofolate reductase [Gammaproteobacteria bacterium]NNJ78842.1 dihydrofolate reductase [Xanthomonadales bacterium]